jgi:hypothetical protein
MHTKKITPDRSKINLNDAAEIKCWTKELRVSTDELRRIVEKVGNSVAAVRKELALVGSPE